MFMDKSSIISYHIPDSWLNYLRVIDSKYRESLDRFEKSKTLKLCLKNAYREFSSKILFRFSKAPAKRSQHSNATCCNIVWRNMLRAFGHCVATCWVLLAQIWPFSNLSQQHPTCRNTSQHGGQTHATCCPQHCCDMLRWHVAIVWPGLKNLTSSRTRYRAYQDAFKACKNTQLLPFA